MRPQVRILSSRPLNVQVVSFGWRLFCLHREGEICGIRCWFTSYMGRGEFFWLRRSAKWPPCLFLRAKVVRRLTRRSDIGPPCWISLSASPAGSRFASAGEKSHLFLRYYLPTNPRYSRSASAGENHPPFPSYCLPDILAGGRFASAGEKSRLFPRYCRFFQRSRACFASLALFLAFL